MTPKKSPSSETRVAVNKIITLRCLPIPAGKDLIWRRKLSSEAPSPACCRSLPQLVRTLSATLAWSTVQRQRYILLQQPQYKNKIVKTRMVCLWITTW